MPAQGAVQGTAQGTAQGKEWLEADGLGGFASGTTELARTRRYHALLLTQTPQGRYVLVNGFEAWLESPFPPAEDGWVRVQTPDQNSPTQTTPITTQRYAPDTLHPNGASLITAFTPNPWPTWTFTLPDGATLTQEIFVAGGQTNLRWTRHGPPTPTTLHLRPLLSGRDYHSLHHENPAFAFTPTQTPGTTTWRPYPDLPPITAHGGAYTHAPDWFRNFLYTEEQARGLDDTEDLASPGTLTWDLTTPATLALRADAAPAWPVAILADAEATERNALSPLHRAARQYIARPNNRPTIIAGYPWFTDWGRDTFISIRGLLLTKLTPAGGNGLDDGPTPRQILAAQTHQESNRATAERILLAWSVHVSQGMLPNRFPDNEASPEYNAVDASLWFVIATQALFDQGASPQTRATLQTACRSILQGYRDGTRYNIAMDADGLIHAGHPGVQLTWMDAKIGNWVVTPRTGKPVEIQALWINALRIAAAWGRSEWSPLADQATAAFLEKFPDPATGGLFDLIDGDPLEKNRIRPNQIFAAGGLPHAILPPAQARQVVDLVESRLLTPLGLRTLDPQDPAYHPIYRGSPLDRDAAYHQGTVWPWLLGPFVQAWLQTRQNTPEAKAEARTRFLPPLRAHLAQAGLNHISEVADACFPHTPGGCPFQAWSLAEFLRIKAML